MQRGREGSFEMVLLSKYERRFTGFDGKIVAMYARGMRVLEILAFLAGRHGNEISPEPISSLTDLVICEVIAWQSGPL